MPMYSKKQTQVRVLLFNKASIKVLAKYSDYSNVFSMENTVELLENTRIYKYTIKLEKDKQLPFVSIYSLKLVKLETLKIYIKINLANGFIWLSKSSTRAFILFDKKPNRSLHLCVNYWSLNNITIKNEYLLLLISKLLDWLGRIRKFI